MAKIEDIEKVMKIFEEIRPRHGRNKIDESRMGIGALLQLLDEFEVLTAGEISEKLEVSTARVAVLLKKMEAKNLVEKKKDKNDGRITRVCLSEKGKEHIKLIKKEIRHYIGNAIDEIGMDKMLDFLETSRKLKEIMPPPPGEEF